MKNFILGAAVALSIGLPATALAQRVPNAQVIVVDTERVFRECTACVAAQAQLQGLATALQQRQQALGAPLQTEETSIQQAAAAARNATGAARTSAEAALQQRMTALQQRATAATTELRNLENNLRSSQANVMQQINARLNPIINQVMTARGANLAVDTGQSLTHAAALNVTDQVLQTLNQQLPAVTVAPLPQQAQPAPQPGR